MGNLKSKGRRSSQSNSVEGEKKASQKKVGSAASLGAQPVDEDSAGQAGVDNVDEARAWVPYDRTTDLSRDDFSRSLPDLSDYVSSEPILTSEDTLLQHNMKNLVSVPLSLFKGRDLTKVLHLDLSENHLFSLPPIMFSFLNHLQELNLSSNHLLSIPPEIRFMTNLEVLDLSNNLLQSLPSELAMCEGLHQLKLQRNRYLTFPPANIHNDLEAIMKFLAHPSTPKITNASDMSVPKSISNNSNDRLKEMIRGCIFGLAIGDAIGLSTENMSKDDVIEHYGKSPSFDFSTMTKDAHRVRWESGHWTEETDQALIVLDSLIDHNGEIPNDLFTRRIQFLVKNGHPEIGHGPGQLTSKTLDKIISHDEFFKNPHRVAWEVNEKEKPLAAGNGSIVRSPFIGIGRFWNLDKVVETTRRNAKITHADERCVASSVAVAVAVALLLQGKYNLSEPYEFTSFMKEIISRSKEDMKTPSYEEEFIQYINTENVMYIRLDDETSRSFTLKPIGCAFSHIKSTNFEESITQIVNEGGDADANAAVCGAILGCKLGYSAIPERWKSSLANAEWLHNKVSFLIATMGIP